MVKTKKNTLLTLDRNLVLQAKQQNLNISQIANDALKNKLMADERMLDWDNYLERLDLGGVECFYLPFAIKGVELKGIGPFKRARLNFGSSLNVVFGGNGTGKSTMVRAVAQAFRVLDRRFPVLSSREQKQGEAKILLYDSDLLVKYKSTGRGSEQAKAEGVRCILLDASLDGLASKHRKAFVNWLMKEYGCQLIITTQTKDIALEMSRKPGAVVIDMDKISERYESIGCRKDHERAARMAVKAAKKAYLKDRLAAVVRDIPGWLEERVRQNKAEIKAINEAKGATRKALLAKLEQRLGISGEASHERLLDEIKRLK